MVKRTPAPKHPTLLLPPERRRLLGTGAAGTATMPGSSSDVIRLNVGDQLFTTTRSTLTKRPGMLRSMFGGNMSPRVTDHRGRPFVSDMPSMSGQYSVQAGHAACSFHQIGSVR